MVRGNRITRGELMKFSQALYHEIHEKILADEPDYEIVEDIDEYLKNNLSFVVIEESLIRGYTRAWDDKNVRSEDMSLEKYLELVSNDLEDITREVLKNVKARLYEVE